ncbi:MAG: hypothetical protein M5R42_04170 [Rhodocyclaceae bacterium]|nr:hypothetical protein [Rhodocyclaceae bacterium]
MPTGQSATDAENTDVGVDLAARDCAQSIQRGLHQVHVHVRITLPHLQRGRIAIDERHGKRSQIVRTLDLRRIAAGDDDQRRRNVNPAEVQIDIPFRQAHGRRDDVDPLFLSGFSTSAQVRNGTRSMRMPSMAAMVSVKSAATPRKQPRSSMKA